MRCFAYEPPVSHLRRVALVLPTCSSVPCLWSLNISYYAFLEDRKDNWDQQGTLYSMLLASNLERAKAKFNCESNLPTHKREAR
ncbi:hypothetical protein BDZ97DRAFT_1785050 [Flammula alnicola]|nr:hypothetical protein BDZ97DRAFT_1785050 [Flammula alnicola]